MTNPNPLTMADLDEKPPRVWEIITPSDPYTMVSADPIVAALAMLCLLHWRGAAHTVDEPRIETPFFPFGIEAQVAEETVQAMTGQTIEQAIKRRHRAIIQALDSVLIGTPRDRALFEAATRYMTPRDATAFRAEWHNIRRTSLNNIGKRAWDLAERFNAEAAGVEP